MKYYTYKKVALAHKAAWQTLKFLAGKGYYLVGVRPRSVTMYDSISVRNIPKDAQAVAGYVGGFWPTYGQLTLEWPASTKKLSIAVNAHQDAECLDVEAGDARADQAAAWVKRQRARGVKKPVLYTSVSQVGLLLRELSKAGISRSEVRLWTAHYNYKPHLCSSACGFGSLRADATQWSNHALNRNLDVSLCSATFFAT